MKRALEYFGGDELAASVWIGKYALKNEKGEVVEETPDEMHVRMAKEFARIEQTYKIKSVEGLSELGAKLNTVLDEAEIYQLFKGFKYIVPQGSIMSMLGNKYAVGSLSNCFVVPAPYDSYGGIIRTDQHLVQLMKRRGGVGTNLNSLRPSGSPVKNAAGTSTGTVSFMDRYSNTTREVAQNGRRGALMLLLSVKHPEIFNFIKVKNDRTKVTGANISVMLTDKFMRAAENNEDFYCRFPVDVEFDVDMELPYNQLVDVKTQGEAVVKVMRVKAREIFDLIVENAWDNAEPGVAYMDRVVDYSPEGVYEQFRPIASNPCFHPDTLIETVNGRIKIRDLTEDMNVYSMDKNGKLCIRRASKSFISKNNAKTLKIKLRSGNEIQVTPEHKLFVHDKGWIEAKDLVLGDRIAHLCRSRRGSKYSGVYLTTDPLNKEGQVMEHRLVTGVNDLSINVHHKNRNTYDNKISNLEILTHSEHSRVTALEDNPQQHQVKGEKGRFISTGKSPKVIIDLPNELKTGMTNQFSNAIVLIEDGETTDVYDIQVSGTHCLIANNMVAHNCGEQWMQAYDACRLLAMNLFGFVINPFTQESYIDYDKLYKVSYLQQRLADDIVDLEIEYVNRIIDKIKNDPEPDEVKAAELELWLNIKATATASRRTGCGITGLGDMLAALGLEYDSDEALAVIDKVMKTKMMGELDCTVDLAITRGTFQGWNKHNEFFAEELGYKNVPKQGNNSFYRMLLTEFPEQTQRMWIYGRRNVSWSTIAPTGSVSILTQTTSGLEPLFLPFYMRRKKVNPSDEGVRVDFVDQNGDSWTEYAVLHPKFKEWLKVKNGGEYDEIDWNRENLEHWFKVSPWYGATANDIDWIQRVRIQGVLQKYTTNAISSTINLPNDVSKESVSNIYMESWKAGLKGVTIYRDGCRTGVLVAETKPKTEVNEFGYHDAPKRPKKLDAQLHLVTIKGERYGVVVGLLNDNPYEVFAFPATEETKSVKGNIVKIKKGHYDFVSDTLVIPNLHTASLHADEQVLTRLVSGLLRHGTNPYFIIEQINKAPLEIVSFGKALGRVLKTYIKEEALKGKLKCNDCNSENVRLQEGCLTCNDCGSSKCG